MTVENRHTAPVEMVELSAIVIGKRRRERLGNITQLADNIDEIGLLHPIVVDDQNLLIVGERRLEACRKLGWSKIPARRFKNVSTDELRQMELDENRYRQDLSAYEKSAQKMRLVEAAEQEAEEEETRGNLPQVSRGKRGPERKTGSARDIAKRSGIPTRTARHARNHLSASEQYPFLKSPHYSQVDALTVSKQLDGMKSEVRSVTTAICSEAAVPPSSVKAIVENIAAMPTADQAEVVRLYLSETQEEQSLAKAKAAKLPPMPDSRIEMLRESIRFLRRAEKASKDQHGPQIKDVTLTVEKILNSIKKGTK